MSKEFFWYRACYIRRGLDENGLKTYKKLRTGYIGELALYKKFESIQQSNLCLKNRWFSNNNYFFQTDAIVVNAGTVYVIEAKNYTRNHAYHNGQWLQEGKKGFHNPFSQLDRSIDLLKQSIQLQNIQGILAYVNQQSTITVDHTAPYSVMTLAEIENWLTSLGPFTQKDFAISNQIDALSINELRTGYFYKLEPAYTLKTGCYCKSCHSFSLVKNNRSFICECGSIEPKKSMINRMIDEYAMLFYHLPITLNGIREITNNSVSENVYRACLSRYKKLGYGMYENPYGKYLTKPPVLDVDKS